MVAYASLITGDKDETTVWINGHGSTIDQNPTLFFFALYSMSIIEKEVTRWDTKV